MKINPSIFAQLEDMRAWAKSTPGADPISLLDYVGFIATLDNVFAFGELFCPELVVHENRKFLKSRFDERVYEEWRSQGKSGAEIQSVMNHLHVSWLIQEQAISDEAAVEAARVIAVVWSRTLAPEGLIVDRVGSDFSDAAVTFYEP